MQTSLKFFVDPEHCMHGMRLQGAQDKIVHPPQEITTGSKVSKTQNLQYSDKVSLDLQKHGL